MKDVWSVGQLMHQTRSWALDRDGLDVIATARPAKVVSPPLDIVLLQPTPPLQGPQAANEPGLDAALGLECSGLV